MTQSAPAREPDAAAAASAANSSLDPQAPPFVPANETLTSILAALRSFLESNSQPANPQPAGPQFPRQPAASSHARPPAADPLGPPSALRGGFEDGIALRGVGGVAITAM